MQMINTIETGSDVSDVISETQTVAASVEVASVAKPTNTACSEVIQLESEVTELADKSTVLGQYDHIVIAKAEVDAQFANAKAEYSSQVPDGDLAKDGKKLTQQKLELYRKVQSIPFHTLMANEALQRFAMGVSAAYADNHDALTKGVEKRARKRREELSVRQSALFVPKFYAALEYLTSDGKWVGNDQVCETASGLCSEGRKDMKAAGTVYFTKSDENGITSTYSGTKSLVELLSKDGEFTSVPMTMARLGLIDQKFVEAGDGERKGRRPVYRMIQDTEDIL
jgi:hypothetical protein